MEFNLESADKNFMNLNELIKTEYVIDPEYAVFLGNLAEFYYSKGENEKAIDYIRDSRKILWKRIAKINYYILNDREGYTKDKIINGLEIDPNLKFLLNEREGSVLTQISDKKKIDTNVKKPTDSKSDYNPITFNSILNFKENEFLFNSEKINKEHNESEEGHNLYFRFNDLLCKIDLKYLLFQLFPNNKVLGKNIIANNQQNNTNNSSNLNDINNYANNSKLKKDSSFNSKYSATVVPSAIQITNNGGSKSDKEKKLNLDILNSILNDLEILAKTLLYPHISFKVILLGLRARLEKTKFIYDFSDFLNSPDFTIIAKKNKLDLDVITKDILIRLTNNYSERAANIWYGYLSKAKENYEKAIVYFKIIPNEFSLFFENLFSLATLFLDLSDVNLYMAEFSFNLNPKFCDITQIINKMNKIANINKFYNETNDELPVLPEEYLSDNLKIEKENYIKERIKKDKLFHRNIVKNSIFMLEQSIKVLQTRKYICENIHDLCLANLIDPSKLPKDLQMQIIENDYLNKKRNKNYLTPALITPKIAIDAFDIFNLFKNYMKEVEYFTINYNLCDDMIKTVSKIHKFLRMNSTNYLNKCNFDILIPPSLSEMGDDLTSEIVKKDSVNVFLIKINSYFNNPEEIKYYFNYILGGNSINPESKDYIYGRIVVNNENLIILTKKLFGLKTAYKASSLLAEAKKKRDLKYLNQEYISILMELSLELMRGKSTSFIFKFKSIIFLFLFQLIFQLEIYTEMKNVENAINKDLLGEISLENIDFWLNLISGAPYIAVNGKFNEFLQEVHRKLFS